MATRHHLRFIYKSMYLVIHIAGVEPVILKVITLSTIKIVVGKSLRNTLLFLYSIISFLVRVSKSITSKPILILLLTIAFSIFSL